MDVSLLKQHIGQTVENNPFHLEALRKCKPLPGRYLAFCRKSFYAKVISVGLLNMMKVA